MAFTPRGNGGRGGTGGHWGHPTRSPRRNPMADRTEPQRIAIRSRLGLAVLAAACVVTAIGAPAAMADSLTFIKDHNVWLANPDGSGQHQVTLDGTASAPYESPSQADDGTIVAL